MLYYSIVCKYVYSIVCKYVNYHVLLYQKKDKTLNFAFLYQYLKYFIAVFELV